MMLIDTTWDKASLYPDGHGYHTGAHAGSIIPSARRYIASIVVHSIATASFDQARDQLLHSARHSMHYLIGLDRPIIQLLDPDLMAWHANPCYDRRYADDRSIAIALHWSDDRGPLPLALQETTRELVLWLLACYPSISLIDMYRAHARPRGCTLEPEGWGDAAFYTWADALLRQRGTTAVPHHTWPALTLS